MAVFVKRLPPIGQGAPVEIKVDSWAVGLLLLARIVRKAMPPAELAKDAETQRLLARWEANPSPVNPPYVFWTDGNEAVQVRDDPRRD